jgi:hypothetical protein
MVALRLLPESNALACAIGCGGSSSGEGCGSDKDCKGDRICVNARCTESSFGDTCQCTSGTTTDVERPSCTGYGSIRCRTSGAFGYAWCACDKNLTQCPDGSPVSTCDTSDVGCDTSQYASLQICN